MKIKKTILILSSIIGLCSFSFADKKTNVFDISYEGVGGEGARLANPDAPIQGKYSKSSTEAGDLENHVTINSKGLVTVNLPQNRFGTELLRDEFIKDSGIDENNSTIANEFYTTLSQQDNKTLNFYIHINELCFGSTCQARIKDLYLAQGHDKGVNEWYAYSPNGVEKKQYTYKKSNGNRLFPQCNEITIDYYIFDQNIYATMGGSGINFVDSGSKDKILIPSDCKYS